MKHPWGEIGLVVLAGAWLASCGPAEEDCDPATTPGCAGGQGGAPAGGADAGASGGTGGHGGGLPGGAGGGLGGAGGVGGVGGGLPGGAGGMGGTGGGLPGGAGGMGGAIGGMGGAIGGMGGAIGGMAGGAGGEPAGVWPEGTRLIELGENGHALVEGTFADGAPMDDLAWARAPRVACWDDPLTDEFYGRNHVLYAFADPLPGWHDVTVTVTPGAPQSEANVYLLLQSSRNFRLPPAVEAGQCFRNRRSPGPGQPVTVSFRIHETELSNAVLGVANRGRWRQDDEAAFTIEVQITPVAAGERCYAALDAPHQWPAHVRRLRLEDGRAAAVGDLDDGFPVCGDLAYLDDQFCVPATQLDYFRSRQVFFALEEPLPPQTFATVTVAPEPGVDVNLYGGWQGTTNFYVPPNYQTGDCEAGLRPRLPHVEGPLFTNPGEPERFTIYTGRNPYNLFFAVAAPEGENGSGGFTVSVETIDLRTDLCEEADYEAVRGLDRWPADVEVIDIVDGRGHAEGDTSRGQPPLCSLDWASTSQNACFPATKRTHFAGNVQFFAIEEPPPAGSHVRFTVTPAPGVDVNIVGYRLGLDHYTVPPLVPSVGACEASYPLDLGEAPNPGVPEVIEFQSIRNPYRYFLMVATREGNELGGAYTVDVEVTEPPPPHCPESLPGARHAVWPGNVTRVRLDEEGVGRAEGDLADGACVNLAWANASDVACFPTTQNERFEGNHVFFALDEPLPPRSMVEITATPTDGGEISLYGLQAGANSYPVPPAVDGGICEASLSYRGPNPGEPETIRFFNPSERNAYNIFFAVAGDADTGRQGTFDIEVRLTQGVVHCEESLPGEQYDAWPASVQQVRLDEQGDWVGEGDLATGACVNLGFASTAEVACFPATQNEHYEGSHVFYALAEPIPPRSVLTLTARPLDPGTDVSLYGIQQGVDSFEVPPRVTGGICEASSGHPAGNPGEVEAITFFNPSPRNRYNVLFAVAGTREGGDAGRFEVTASLRAGQTHCPESLPGRRHERWPVTVRPVSLDAGGRATVRSDLSEGACTNLAWASNSQVACFPTTQNERFEGNHVFFALDEPLPPNRTLVLRADPEVNLYAYLIGPDEHLVPPYVPSVVACEANPDPGAEIRLNTVAHPYNVFFGVAGPDGVTEGAFEVELRLEGP